MKKAMVNLRSSGVWRSPKPRHELGARYNECLSQFEEKKPTTRQKHLWYW
jgi:hypothetical protein